MIPKMPPEADVQVEVVDGPQRAEVLGQAAYRQHRFGVSRIHWSRPRRGRASAADPVPYPGRDPVHGLLVEDSAGAEDENQGDEAAEHDHPVPAEHAQRFQQTDVDNHADQRTEEGAEATDQAVGEGVHPQHDPEVPGDR